MPTSLRFKSKLHEEPNEVVKWRTLIPTVFQRFLFGVETFYFILAQSKLSLYELITCTRATK